MRRHLRFLLLSILFLASPMLAQQWTTRYNSSGGAMDETASMVTADERVYIAGSSYSASDGWNIVTICLDRAGGTVWEKSYSTAGDEKAVAVVADASGNSYVLGNVWENDNRRHLVLLAYNNLGVLQWTKVFTAQAASSDIGVGLGLLSNGTLVTAAESRMNDGTSSSVVTAFNPDAAELWKDSYTGTGSAFPRSLVAGSRVAMSGLTTGGGDSDGFVVLYDAAGARIAANTFDGGSGLDEIFALTAFDAQGKLYCAGWTMLAPASTRVLLAEYNPDGSFASDFHYSPGNDGRHRATALDIDPAGNALLTARLDAGSGDFNVFITRRGPNPWERVYSPSGGMPGDQTPPSFMGATAAYSSATGSLTVVWHPAEDDQAMRDELQYRVYVATSPGGQNFSAPDAEVTGTDDATISGLLPGETYYVVVRASDPSSNTENNTREFVVTLAPPALRVTTVSVPDAMPGQTYSTMLAAEGGQTPYTWSLVEGDIPPGLVVTGAGLISGTPLDDGSYTYTVQVRDAVGDSASSVLVHESLRPPALRVSTDMTIPGGEHWYSTIIIEDPAILTISDDAVIHAVDSILVDGTITADCHQLELRTTESLTVGGSISNACPFVPEDPPGIKIVADGELLLGYVPGPDPSVISDGDIMITDSFTENADLTPVFVEELFEKTPELQRLSSDPTRVAKGGGAKVNRPPQAGKGKANSLPRDGDIDVNGDMDTENGADAGGPTVVGGIGGTLSIASRNGVLTIAAGLTLSAGNGGKGMPVVTTGCPAVADAAAGKGGRGGSLLLGGNSIVFGAGVVLNRGNGGAGGDATATGDPAAGPCADGCGAQATSGPGGDKGGIGYILTHPGAGIVGAPTEGGGNGGKGGTATATASNGADCPTCPGGKGGDGKDATATGGKGGNGAKGKIWPIVAGTHKAGDGGDAIATGGSGGAGADCCTPPKQGGNGGNGKVGNATGGDPGPNGITPGAPGTYTAQGGNAGPGGDGKLNGTKGTPGVGIGAGTAGTKNDGAAGADGVVCFNIHFWFIYFSTLSNGFITPGIPMKLKACATQDTSSQEAEAEVAFLTQNENQGMEVQYEKLNDDVIIFGGGLKVIPSGTTHPQFPGATWWNGGMTLDFRPIDPLLSGQVTIEGLNQLGEEINQSVTLISPSSPPVVTAALQPVQGTVYHGVVVRTTVPIRFNHWWLGGWFIDP